MKGIEPLSAFAVYKKMYGQTSDPSSKLKKFKTKKSKKQAGLNPKKVLLGLEKNDISLKTSKSAVTTSHNESSSKCKHKSIKKDKESPSSKSIKKDKESPTSKPIKKDKESPTSKSIKKEKEILEHEFIKIENESPGVKKVERKRKRGKRNNESNSYLSDMNELETTNDNENAKENGEEQMVMNDPINEGLKLFEWMINPMNIRQFFKTYWETEPLYVSRKDKKYYSTLFSSTIFDKILRENSLYYTRNVDVVIYQNEEKEVLNQEGKANPSALWDFYSTGCSVRLLNPQTYHKKIHLLLTTLQEYFGSMVGANVYLTPPDSQGFAPHYDDIEAFVLQIEGRKHWKLYHPKDEDMLARHSSKNFKHEELGEPFLEVALEAGSMLYFPRGVIHEGWTDSEAHSLHITVSVYQNNAYVDLLEKALPLALMKAAKSDLEFRKGLPLHFLRSTKAKITMKKRVLTLIDKLKEYLDVEDGLEELGRKLVYDSMPPALSPEESSGSSKEGGDLLDNGVVYNKVEFDLSNKVRLTRYHCIQLERRGEQPKLYYSTENSKIYHGEEEQCVELDESMVPLIVHLQKAYPSYVRIGDLPLDDTEVKVQLVYDLWEKGILLTTA